MFMCPTFLSLLLLLITWHTHDGGVPNWLTWHWLFNLIGHIKSRNFILGYLIEQLHIGLRTWSCPLAHETNFHFFIHTCDSFIFKVCSLIIIKSPLLLHSLYISFGHWFDRRSANVCQPLFSIETMCSMYRWGTCGGDEVKILLAQFLWSTTFIWDCVTNLSSDT